MKFFSIDSKNNNYLVYFIFLIIFILQLYISYNGVINAFYFDIYDFNLDRTLFKNDLYLQNSLLIDNSILFKVFKLFKINLHNDLIGIPLYIIVNLIGILYFIKFLINIIGKDKKALIISLILIIVFFNNNITLSGIKSVFLTSHTGTPTSILMPLSMIILYYLQKKNFVITGLISIIFILLSVRIFWFPILVTYLSIFLDLKNNSAINRKIVYSLFFLFVACIFYLLITKSNLLIDFNFRLELVEDIFDNALGEDNILLHWLYNKVSVLKLIFSFFLYTFLLKKVNFKDTSIKNLFTVVLISYIALIIAHLLYVSYIYKFFPSVEIIGLNPIRAVYFYNVFLSLLIFLYAHQKISDHFLKILILFFLFLLNRFDILNEYFYYTASIFLAISILFFKIKDLKNYSYAYLLLMLMLIQLSWFAKNINNPKIYKLNFDLYSENSKILKFQEMSYDMFGKFNKKEFDQLADLQSCDDFILLYLDASKEYVVHNFYANWYFKKSRFYNLPGHLYLSKDFKIFKEHKKRKNYLDKIMGRDAKKDADLNRIPNPSKINEKLVKNIVLEYNMMVIIKNSEKINNNFLIYHNEDQSKCIDKLKNKNIKSINLI